MVENNECPPDNTKQQVTKSQQSDPIAILTPTSFYRAETGIKLQPFGASLNRDQT